MEFLQSLPQDRLIFYYLVVMLSGIYTLFRFGISKLTILVFLIFWYGFFSYLSKMNIISFEYYKVGVFVYAAILFGPNIFKNKLKTDNLINISFILFSVSFWISNVPDRDTFFSLASQYGFKFSFPFLVYHGLKEFVNYPNKMQNLGRLLLFIIYLQIGFSILKIILFGITEALVGSLSSKGAGVAVILPLLAYILYWLQKRGNFTIRDWLYVFSFLIIAIASAKRATVFLYPAIILITMVFLRKNIQIMSVIRYLPVILLLFYIGLKTNPTLNPEQSNWGSFDLNYAITYSLNYTFGVDEVEKIGEEVSGRGGSLLILFSPNALNLKENTEILFGHGLYEIIHRTYGRFQGGEEYGIESEGLVGKGLIMVYSFGYLGFCLYLFFIFSILMIIKNLKFKIFISFLFLWDLFFYGNMMFNSNELVLLTILICFFSNYVFYTANTQFAFNNKVYPNWKPVLK